MTIIDLLYQERIKYPKSSTFSILGGVGDSLLYIGLQDKTFLEQTTFEFENFTSEEANTLISCLLEGLSSGNRLRIGSKFYTETATFLEESWLPGAVTLKLNLKELR